MLFKHQKQALRFMLLSSRGALLMDMGTGKTRVVLEYLKRTGEQTLVVAPKSVISSWEKELTFYPDLSYTILTGTREERLEKLESHNQIHLINYDYLCPILLQLIRRGYHTLILDESTMVKSIRAKRTGAAIRLADEAEKVFILTGFPIANSPLDAYSQFRMLGKDVFGDSFYSFRDYHCVMGGYGGYEVIEYNDLEGMRDRMSEFSFARKKEECLDLPPKLFEERKVSMLPEQKQIYKQVKKDLLTELGGSTFYVSNVLTKMLRLSQVVGGQLIMDDGKAIEFPSCKDEEVLRVVEESGDQKVVVWVRFLYEYRKLLRALFPFGVVGLCGETENRGEVIQSFQNPSGPRIIVCQVQVGKFGVSLTSGTIALYYSKTYSLEDYVQSQDRIHRIGQNQSVTIINLNAKGTLDISLQRALDGKRNLADFVTPSSLRDIVNGSI